MAYDPRHLSVLAYANGFTLWHYRSEEPLSRLTGDAYFGTAHDLFRTGDMMLINAADGGALVLVEANAQRSTVHPLAASLAAAQGPARS